MKGFRLAAKKLFLTYPRCNAPKEELLDFLKIKCHPVIHICVSHEKHADGGSHLHAVVFAKEKLDFKDANCLDLRLGQSSWHGSYEACKNYDKGIEYVKKDKDFIEYGEYLTKEQKKKLTRKEKNQFFLSKPVHELVDEGDLCLMQAASCEKAKLAYYNSKRTPNSDYNHKRECLWIYGTPGCGKSAWVRQEKGDSLYYKTPDKWWDSYQGERHVILEDLDITKARELVMSLKLWSDKYNFSAECKGGRKFMDYDGFYITSNYLPCELWNKEQDGQLVAAITRRFKFYTTEIDTTSDDFRVNLIKFKDIII